MDNTINSENIYDIYLKRFEEYKKYTDFIKNIKLNDKIGRNGYKNFCVYQNENLQGIKRWWYAENKVKTLEYLHELFDYYFEYLENIISIFKGSYQIQNKKNNFIIIINNNITHQDEIINGLNNLLETYKDDDKDILDFISLIKMFFNNFKTSAEIIVKDSKKNKFNN
jgi:hypothetical protein